MRFNLFSSVLGLMNRAANKGPLLPRLPYEDHHGHLPPGQPRLDIHLHQTRPLRGEKEVTCLARAHECERRAGRRLLSRQIGAVLCHRRPTRGRTVSSQHAFDSERNARDRRLVESNDTEFDCN